MATLSEHVIVAGAENYPLMLKKLMYDSWASRMWLYIKGKNELNEPEQLQDDYDVHETNIILHGLPPDVYSLVNHQEVAKDIWDKSKLLMKGIELSYRELSQQSQAESPQFDSGLAVPTFQQGEHLIDCINKAMAFLSVVASWFSLTNNQLRMSSNPRNQATIQDEELLQPQRETMQLTGIAEDQATQQTIPLNSAFQTKDDAYDSDCDDVSSAKAILMVNLSSCDLDVLSEVNDVNVRSKSISKRNKKRKVWKPTGKVFSKIRYRWKPSGRIFTIVGNMCPLTRFASTKVVPLKETTIKLVITPTLELKVVQIVLWYLDFRCSKHMIENRSQLINFVKVVTTACYTQNQSLIYKHHNKTPYELLHDRKLDLSFLYVFGALGYPTNDSEDLGKLKPKADIGIFIGYAPTKTVYRIYNNRTRLIIENIHVDFDEMTTMASEQFGSESMPQLISPRIISSGLVQNPPSPTPYVPLTKNDWDTLFHPMDDEYFNPLPSFDPQVHAVVAPEPVDSTNTPSSTTVDQDAPSASTSQTPKETPSLVIHLDVKKADHDIEVANMNNDHYFGLPIPEPSSESSSSRVVTQNNVHSINQPPYHINKWTKDHLLNNIIGDLSRPISTRQQL
nr:hypothetical protein [Tanacetum cinerariifolium]